tara:strand:- start:1203 stop:1529 length:327 start_codon:yes stop_codon:yes gene_type:complete
MIKQHIKTLKTKKEQTFAERTARLQKQTEDFAAQMNRTIQIKSPETSAKIFQQWLRKEERKRTERRARKKRLRGSRPKRIKKRRRRRRRRTKRRRRGKKRARRNTKKR